MWVMQLTPGLMLREGEGGELKTVSELRGMGLPSLVGSLTGACALPVERCISLTQDELGGLLLRAEGVDRYGVGAKSYPAARDLQDSYEGSMWAGAALVNYGALWENIFIPENLALHYRLQADLAAACRVDPGIGYRTLQSWGAGFSEATGVSVLLPPMAGWQQDSRELDGPASAAMFDLMPAGEDALESYLAGYREDKEAERRLHTLSYEPVPPAIIDGGNASRMEVAITLDDGGNMDLRILDLLESYGIRCTVFPAGRVAELHPDWLQRMDAHGWEVANHTYTHPITKPTRLIDLPDEEVKAEIITAQQVIFDAVGKKYPYFRPPGGWVDERVAALAGDLGYVTVMWSLDSGDTRNPQMSPLDRANTILDKVKPGYILLFHFGGNHTYETLQYLIPQMQARGYHFVTLSELFQP
jgi:peptidoglycan/xylan/chitin deacetylase (PgdA/CDA1 family)